MPGSSPHEILAELEGMADGDAAVRSVVRAYSNRCHPASRSALNHPR